MVVSESLLYTQISKKWFYEKDWLIFACAYRFYIQAYEDRDTTVGEGFFVNDVHFDVHRFHPPLIYGRRGGPDDGEGIALCRYKPNQIVDGTENYNFLLITYKLPILSAKAVP